jgi:hypothetical protein
MTCVGVLLLAGMLVSCGGGGGGGDSPSIPGTTTGGGPGNNTTPPDNNGTPPANGGSTPPSSGGSTPPSSGGSTPPSSRPGRFEETDLTVTLSPGHWKAADARYGWSGGSAVRSEVQGATVSFTFIGTWVTWIGARNENSGVAMVSVDGGPAKRVDLYARPNEIRTPIITLHDLSPGQHVLTIQVTGEKNKNAPLTSPAVVVVDAFDVEAPIVSHFQDRHPAAVYTGTWALANKAAYPPQDRADPIDHSAFWSGGAVASAPEGPNGGATFTTTAGDTVTLTFRGTSITWQSGLGPDFGIASVQLDGGAPQDVDTYSETPKFQVVVFTATGLADGVDHTLTITATDRKRDASTGIKIVVDAFDVTTPGRRFQEDDLDPKTGLPATTYTGKWTRSNVNRVWSEGAAHTSQDPGARAIFKFTGTGVSYIGCQKNSIGPVNIYLDGVLVDTIQNFKFQPIEAFQQEIYRSHELTPGEHTLEVEAVSSISFIVVDAFDVRP